MSQVEEQVTWQDILKDLQYDQEAYEDKDVGKTTVCTNGLCISRRAGYHWRTIHAREG
jgi:hypothetical protein